MSRRLGLVGEDPEFRKLWLGETISAFGSAVTYLAFSLVAIVLLGAGPTEIGILVACFTAPGVLLGLVAGAIVDRVRRRPVLIAANLLEAALLSTIPIAHIGGWLSMPQLYVIGILDGVVFGFARPAYAAFLPSLVGRERVMQANAGLAMSRSAADTVGPGFAGLLVQWLTAPIAIAADALSFAVAGVAIASINAPGDAAVDATTRRNIGADIRDGLRLTLRDPVLRSITGTEVILRFFQLAVVANYVVFIASLFGEGAALVFGVVTVPGGIGQLLGSSLAPWLPRRIGLGRTFLLGAALLSVSPFFMPLATNDLVGIAALSLAAVIGATGDVMTGVHLESVRQVVTPDAILGRVTASTFVLIGIAMLAGSIVGGILGDAAGSRQAILAAAIGHLLVLAWVAASPLRTIRNVPTSRE